MVRSLRGGASVTEWPGVTSMGERFAQAVARSYLGAHTTERAITRALLALGDTPTASRIAAILRAELLARRERS